MDNDDLSLLLSSAERWFAGHAPLAERVAAFRDGHHEPAGAWARFAEMGWTALTLPEAQGGFGASTVQAFELLRRAGADARPEPLGLHLLLAPGVAETLPDTAEALADGRMRLALAEPPQRGGALAWNGRQLSGSVPLADGLEHATHLLVPLCGGADALLLVDLAAAGIERTPARLVDGRATARLAFDGVSARVAGEAARARDLAAAACVADAGGVFEAAFTMTLDYLKQRVQFGKPLASQQAIQHRMAEVFCDLQQQLALAGRLAAEIDAEPAGPWPTLPVAKSFVGRRVLRGVGALIQLSGGIAVTEEYRLTHLYRRLHVAAQLHGAAEAQLARIAVRATLLAA
ncbi:acyl-CoA dehydrogenase family protein [Piscinibacter sp.]|uniref:acyl-CoA dehydrogenase family protein n=1 Tax=Piscinibacter sp. TaxID=1903157 RepID=UPI0039E3AE6C